MKEKYDIWFKRHYKIRYYGLKWQVINQIGEEITVLFEEETYTSATTKLAILYYEVNDPSLEEIINREIKELEKKEKEEKEINQKEKEEKLKEKVQEIKKGEKKTRNEEEIYKIKPYHKKSLFSMIDEFKKEIEEKPKLKTKFLEDVIEEDGIKLFKTVLSWKELIVNSKEIIGIFKDYLIIISKKDVLKINILDDRDKETIYKYNSERILMDFLIKCSTVCSIQIDLEETGNEISWKLKTFIFKENRKNKKMISKTSNLHKKQESSKTSNLKQEHRIKHDFLANSNVKIVKKNIVNNK